MRGAALAVAATLLASAGPPAAGSGVETIGDLSKLLPRRVTISPVTAGQAFAVAITPGGSLVAGPYALKVPGGKGPLVLTLETPVVQQGRFSSPVRLKNSTGLPLAGLRVDVTGATVPPSAPENAPPSDLRLSPPSPLWFGELAPDRESAPLLLILDGLPEVTGPEPVVILGVVTGASVLEPPKDAASAPARRKVGSQTRRSPGNDCPAEALADVRGEGWGQAAAPTACRVARSGDLWVVDSSGDPVKVYGSRGSFLRSFGPEAAKGATDLVLAGDGSVELLQAGEEEGAVPLRVLRPF